MCMTGVSKDGFIGGATGDGAISLFSGSKPVHGSYIITSSMAWGAGAEVYDQVFGVLLTP